MPTTDEMRKSFQTGFRKKTGYPSQQEDEGPSIIERAKEALGFSDKEDEAMSASAKLGLKKKK